MRQRSEESERREVWGIERRSGSRSPLMKARVFRVLRVNLRSQGLGAVEGTER